MKNREIYEEIVYLTEKLDAHLDKLNPSPRELKSLEISGLSYRAWVSIRLKKFQELLNNAKYKNDLWQDANLIESKMNHLKIRADFGTIKFDKNGHIISDQKTIDKWLYVLNTTEKLFYACDNFCHKYRARSIQDIKENGFSE
jgi:hypothetical protein